MNACVRVSPWLQPGFAIDPYASLCLGNLAYVQSDTFDDKEWERLIRIAFNSYKAVLKVLVYLCVIIYACACVFVY
jgi:hypothetical protein